MTRTYSAKQADITRKWYVVDANGKTLGHLATQIAIVLRGKHKPTFTPHMDTGDHVIVVNAEKIHLTGDKVRSRRPSKMCWPANRPRLWNVRLRACSPRILSGSKWLEN